MACHDDSTINIISVIIIIIIIIITERPLKLTSLATVAVQLQNFSMSRVWKNF